MNIGIKVLVPVLLALSPMMAGTAMGQSVIEVGQPTQAGTVSTLIYCKHAGASVDTLQVVVQIESQDSAEEKAEKIRNGINEQQAGSFVVTGMGTQILLTPEAGYQILGLRVEDDTTSPPFTPGDSLNWNSPVRVKLNSPMRVHGKISFYGTPLGGAAGLEVLGRGNVFNTAANTLQYWMEHTASNLLLNGIRAEYTGEEILIKEDLSGAFLSVMSADPGLTLRIEVFCIEQYTGEIRLTAEQAGNDEWFGQCVAISGDYAIVGVPREHSGAGSAYIFHWNGTTWKRHQKLTASERTPWDWFGCAVDMWEDYAIVGARRDDDVWENAGAAYIFQREGTTWELQQRIVGERGELGDECGSAVALWEDYAIVGAPHDDDKGFNSGSAYIFRREESSWKQQQKLVAEDGEEMTYFGLGVGIWGEYAIAGGPKSMYIFHREGSTWKQQTRLEASLQNMGGATDLWGDYAIVGGNKLAYVFHREGDIWRQQQKLLPNDPMPGICSCSVSLWEDYAAVGIENGTGRVKGSGVAYVFHRSGTIWKQSKLAASDGGKGDEFGWSVAVGGNRVIVGARNDTYSSRANPGSAYAYSGIDLLIYVDQLVEPPVVVEEDGSRSIPGACQLGQNYPNPFNATTIITYDLPRSTDVTLRIYTLMGQKVTTVVSEHQAAGHYEVTWDGSGYASGIYFYQLEAGGLVQTERMVLIN